MTQQDPSHSEPDSLAAITSNNAAADASSVASRLVELICDLEYPNSGSEQLDAGLSLVSVKRYLAEPRYRIRLHDVMRSEIVRLAAMFEAPKFETSASLHITTEQFQARIRDYEDACQPLLESVAAIAYFGLEENSSLLPLSIRRLIPHNEVLSAPPLVRLTGYPALITQYSSGIAAISGERFANLASVLLKPRYSLDYGYGTTPAIQLLNCGIGGGVFGEAAKYCPIDNAARRKSAASDYVFEALRPILSRYCMSASYYEDTFDIFEYIVSLVYRDVIDGGSGWAPVGRYWPRYHSWGGNSLDRSPIGEFVKSVVSDGTSAPLLQAGFFGGNIDRFVGVEKTHRDWLGSLRS